MFFSRAISYGGKINKIPPKIPGQSREIFVYVFFSLCVFSLPNLLTSFKTFFTSCNLNLVAPYCALPRDYLSDTPLLRAMGFLVSQHGRLGAIPPPPFSKRFPLGEHVKWRCDTPPQKGYLSDTCAIPYENKANGCDTPLCDTISKGYCAIWGGISHWAAKNLNLTLPSRESRATVWKPRFTDPGATPHVL